MDANSPINDSIRIILHYYFKKSKVLSRISNSLVYPIMTTIQQVKDLFPVCAMFLFI